MKTPLLILTCALIVFHATGQNLEIYKATGFSDPAYEYDDADKTLTIDFWIKNDGYHNSDATKIKAYVINKDKDDEETELDSYDLPGISYSSNAGANTFHVEQWTINLGNKELEEAEYKVRFHINPDKSAYETEFADNAMTFGSSFYFTPKSTGIGFYDEHKVNDKVQAFPNPASGATTFQFDLENQSSYELRIYDMSGKLMKAWGNISASNGTQNFKVNLDNLKSGPYFYTLIVNDELVSTQKLMVSK